MSAEVFRPRKEFNKVTKKGRPKDIKVGILIPLPYVAACSSLVMHLFYEYINGLEDAIAYRFVYNIDEDVVEALDHNISLRHLDLILVSASFELDYINIAHILSSLKLLPHQKNNFKPLIVAGGLAPSANPLPLSNIVDAVAIGEVDEVLLDIVYSAQDENPLKLLENIKCMWIPSLNYTKIKRKIVENLDNVFHPIRQVYSLDEEPVFGHGLRVELSRGCPYLCPFCMESHIMYPFRFRSSSTIWRIIEKGINLTSATKRVIIYSLSFYSIPYADQLLNKLLYNGIQASIPSLRVEHITSRRLETMYELGQKTLTIAPETLVERYGCRIGKCVEIDKVADIVLNAYGIGYNHVKLYLITGFPKFNIEEEIISLKKLLDKIKPHVRKKEFLEISLNVLIPKPWTPYQYLPPGHVLEIISKIGLYKDLVKNYKFVSLDIMDPRWGFAQAIITQGNGELSKLIVECAIERCTLSQFLRFVNSNIDKLSYVVRGWGGKPPWMRIIDVGFNVGYLDNRFKYLTMFND
ncbi:MAG: radical SAM protein [Ignisphaera sp.]